MIDAFTSEKRWEWLDERPSQVSVAMAARAALRALPVLGALSSKRSIPKDRRAKVVLPVFRAVATAWTAARYPVVGGQNAHATYGASFAAQDAARDGERGPGSRHRPIDNGSWGAAQAASHAARAAAFFQLGAAEAAYRADDDDAPTAASDADSAASQARSGARGSLPDTAPPGSADSRGDDIDAAFAADAAFIDGGGSGFALAARPLWLNGIPQWVQEEWARLKSGLPKGEHWEVWARWYEARRDGKEPIETLAPHRLLQDRDFWRQSPREINAALEAEERRWRDLKSRPAPFDYRVIGGKIDVAPEAARSIDTQTSHDLQAECVRKVSTLKERLDRMQADDGVRADIEMLLERLSSAVLRPGLILSSLRSLEGIAHAYDSVEGRAELRSDALKDIFDLADTVRELAATFPNAREIEAEAISLRLPLELLNEIERPIARAAVVIYVSDGATAATKESVEATAAAIGTSRDLAGRAKQVAYHLLDVGNITRAGLRHLEETGQRIGAPSAKIAEKARLEILGLADDTWKVFRKDFSKRAGRAASVAIVGGIGALLHTLGQELAAIATTVAAFAPIDRTIKELKEPTGEEQHSEKPSQQSNDNAASQPVVANSRKR
jgi:hypothetical protein